MIAKGKTIRVFDPYNDDEEFGIVLDSVVYDSGEVIYTIKFPKITYSLSEKEIFEVK